jgi:hypothetical protein
MRFWRGTGRTGTAERPHRLRASDRRPARRCEFVEQRRANHWNTVSAYSERHAVDAILVDLRESGWTLTPDTRALRSLTRVPMYTMTEPGDPMLDAAADLAGYFSKRVRVEALIGTLSVLQRRLR